MFWEEPKTAEIYGFTHQKYEERERVAPKEKYKEKWVVVGQVKTTGMEDRKIEKCIMNVTELFLKENHLRNRVN